VPLSVKYPATETIRPLSEQPLAPKQAQQKKGWGFFGRKSAAAGDMRTEPFDAKAAVKSAQRTGAVARPAPAPAGRATAQPMPRPDAPNPAGGADDLFPDHKRDEQFEIPAFLRRQSS